jgi:hypothetical protein
MIQYLVRPFFPLCYSNASGEETWQFLKSWWFVLASFPFSRSHWLPVWRDQAPPPAQQTPSANPSQPPQAKSPDKSKDNREIKRQEETGTSNDRLFYTLPNFLTVETMSVPPLTAGQKFKVVTRGSFDYIQIPWYGFLAGVSQTEDSEPGYGQGAVGYGKRFGHTSLTAPSRTILPVPSSPPCSTRIRGFSSRVKEGSGPVPATQSAGSSLLAPIQEASSSTIPRSWGARFRQPFPPIATIRGAIARCPRPSAYGGLRSGTTQ